MTEREHCVVAANEWFSAPKGLNKENLADLIERERADARTEGEARIRALEQALAPLMIVEAPHQRQPGSAVCWANCARCQLDRAKTAFTKLGGTGGGR